MFRRLPILSWLPKYSFELLRTDAAAGLTMGIVVVPQGIAYALLAELPPVYGLYAALAPLPIYTLLGSSRHLSIGPFALISILVADAVSGVVPKEAGTEEYVSERARISSIARIVQQEN